MTALGPIGQLGLTRVRAPATPSNVYWIDFPEPGRWALSASCEGRGYTVSPLFITVAADGPDASIDVHVVR